MATRSRAPEPEFVRSMRVDDLAEGDVRVVELDASADECLALAARFGLLALDRLHAACTIEREAALVRVEFAIEADVVQACVVSLEPVPARITAKDRATFAAGGRPSGREIDIDVDDDDPPEPIIGGAIELGEVIAEILGLALDPYPRAPGVEFGGWSDQSGDGVDGPKPTPFSVLARLKR